MRIGSMPRAGRLLALALSLSLIVTLVTLGGLPRGQAQGKTLTIGITLPLTGADLQNQNGRTQKPHPAPVCQPATKHY